VTGIAVADDDSELIAEPTVKLDMLASPLVGEQIEASVYLVRHRPLADPPWMKIPETGRLQPTAKSIFFRAYWQADIDLARSSLP
jgi:hypothetical protein